jgi:DNA modification methylase
MIENWERIDRAPLENLSALPENSKNVIAISTFFSPAEKLSSLSPSSYELTDNSICLLGECVRRLRFGGLLFIYGLPHHLTLFGQYLSLLKTGDLQMLFKHWIALDIDAAHSSGTLRPAHQGLLMFLKCKPDSNGATQIQLNLDAVRVPHAYCSSCNLNVKDWGGKKHLMNPRGVALSDVWRDLNKIQIRDHITPDAVLDRILALTDQKDGACLHVVQDKPAVFCESKRSPISNNYSLLTSSEWKDLKSIEPNKFYQGDCISFLEKISTLYPGGLFDLVFADPPYNLKKSYDRYEDALAEKHYIDWCNRWLGGMVRSLKPGGSLFVLNLPKWAIHHAAFLNHHLEFRHWIVWDAMSDPRGKIMPAHYALLYYTKPDGKSIFNHVPPPDSPKYCLRAGCIKRRKAEGDNDKVELSDVWIDLHRIRHKRDRDAHPCQLPEKLMERIILMTTDKGGMVFDPFCGTGTTALAACKLNRNFVAVDLDPNYVRIATEKLAGMEQNANLSSLAIVSRRAIKRAKTSASKREIEIYLQKLALRLGREPTDEEIGADDADMLRKIDLVYPTRLAAIKRCRVVLKGKEASASDEG